MNVSAKVDVVMADAIRVPIAADGSFAVELTLPVDTTPKAVDVSLNPNRRIIVLAPTKAEGYDEARALGIEPVAVITPRSLGAAHGIIADELMDASNLTPEVREALLPHAMPSFATTTDPTGPDR